MKHIALCLVAALSLAACKQDESVAGYDGGKTWTLAEMDGAPFDANATMIFGDKGKVVGQAPCNKYFTTQTLPYPWIKLEAIGSTRMACPDLEKETTYFDALIEMTEAEVSGDAMILRNDAGREMVFKAASDDG